MTTRHVALAAAAVALAVAGAVASFGAPRDHSLPGVQGGFVLTVVAHVAQARELAFAANGDLFVGTGGDEVDLIADADGTPAEARRFVHIDDAPLAGVAFAGDALIVGGQFGVWRIPYRVGDRTPRSAPVQIAKIRTSGASSDHHTTSIAFSGGNIYASVGSSCDACDPELDATRATIQEMEPSGASLRAKAVRIRNAIALTVNSATGTVWAGSAGQDALERGHPYEPFDPVSTRVGVADYGWPWCYENRRPTAPGRDCSNVVVPAVVFPAYETPIGAAFYPATHGRYAFGTRYEGGAFVALHGSWHTPPVPPRVVFVAFDGDVPRTAVDWHDPGAQWRDFIGGFQRDSGERIGRPTGVAVGPEGSLFVADDTAGVIYRIRPEAQTR